MPLEKLQMKISVGERGLELQGSLTAFEAWRRRVKTPLEKLQISRVCW